jgi:hypothetical protein
MPPRPTAQVQQVVGKFNATLSAKLVLARGRMILGRKWLAALDDFRNWLIREAA